MNYFEKRKLQKYLDSLTPKQIKKLKEKLKTHCLHNVSFNSDIPCLSCMTESVRSGDITQIMPFLLNNNEF
jgi:hypothetical protein